MTKITKATSICLLLCILYACKKSGPEGFNESMLTDRDWKSSTSDAPFYILRFNSDKSGYLKSITNVITETYQTFPFNWTRKGNDSISTNFDNSQKFTIKVYSVNESNLVVNNWMSADTARATYYAD